MAQVVAIRDDASTHDAVRPPFPVVARPGPTAARRISHHARREILHIRSPPPTNPPHVLSGPIRVRSTLHPVTPSIEVDDGHVVEAVLRLRIPDRNVHGVATIELAVGSL